MKIGNLTAEVLKSFSLINTNIVIKPGQPIRTMSQAKNILAAYEPTESFPSEFGLYDLTEFLAAVELIEDAEVEFEDKFVQVGNGSSSMKYFYSDPSILSQPGKDIKMPSVEVQLKVTEDVINQVKKAATVLGHNDVAIVGENGKVSLKVFDKQDTTANTYKTTLDESNACAAKFEFVMNVSNLKFIPGDYSLEISKAKITQWVHATVPVKYFVALEKESTYGDD